ncbi:uncharacterized protein LOC117332081 [Pecten maximus]|uniref:uncharacterized protein LOC117332081 n=1 Tax=Pecten maximus TaxID=6579 RepID=UPI0014585DD3|nr:uncharacterized protein LOC117332081 [Pecten maximus]
MDCGCDPEFERDPICDDDPALGTNDEVAGYLNRLVDQSITDLIEEDNTLGEFQDEESPLPDFKNQNQKKTNNEFSPSKSLPCLDLKQMDGIPKAGPQTQRTSSLPSVKRKPSPVRLDLDLRRNILIRQYRKAMVDSYVNHVPVIREEPETSSRRVTAADLVPDPSSVASKKTAADLVSDPSSVASKKTAAGLVSDPSCVASKETTNNTDDDLDDEIGDFVSESLSSITRENALDEETMDDQVDDFINRSLMAVVDETASMLAMEEMEKELHTSKAERDTEKELHTSKAERDTEKELHTSKAERDTEKELHTSKAERDTEKEIATPSTVSEAEKETKKEFSKDKEGHSIQCAPASICSEEKKDVTVIKESLDQAETTIDAKESSKSVFGFIFNRRRSIGSLKLKLPCLGLVCCTSPQDVDEDRDVTSNLNSRQTKKPGLLKRLFPFLRKRSARVAPLVTEC